MDKKYGYFIFGGMLLGAILGLMWAADGNIILGLGMGALAGTALGWFGAAAAMEKAKGKREDK